MANKDIQKESKKPKKDAATPEAEKKAAPKVVKGKEATKYATSSPVLACGGPKCTGPAADFQDKKYGAGRRVHTVSKNGAANCTVCGATR